MPTGRFREPVSSSPVSLMGSRRPASGSVLVLPPKFSASPGWFYERARDSVLPSPPPSSVASECLSEGQSPGCEGAPRPSSCGPSFLSGDSWRRQPLTRPPIAQLLPACAVHPKTFNHLPLSPTNIQKQKQTNKTLAFIPEQNTFCLLEGFPGRALSRSRPGQTTYQRVEEGFFLGSPEGVSVLVSFQVCMIMGHSCGRD